MMSIAAADMHQEEDHEAMKVFCGIAMQISKQVSSGFDTIQIPPEILMEVSMEIEEEREQLKKQIEDIQKLAPSHTK